MDTLISNEIVDPRNIYLVAIPPALFSPPKRCQSTFCLGTLLNLGHVSLFADFIAPPAVFDQTSLRRLYFVQLVLINSCSSSSGWISVKLGEKRAAETLMTQKTTVKSDLVAGAAGISDCCSKFGPLFLGERVLAPSKCPGLRMIAVFPSCT